MADALLFPATSGQRLALAAAIAGVTYFVLILTTFPEYSVQLLSAGVSYVDDAVIALTQNVYRTNGLVGLGLVYLYALLTGITATNAIAEVRLAGVSQSKDLLGVAPGLVASGCASCGAGLLGVLGLAGVLAALPFHGNLVRAGGLLLLLSFLARSGDPRTCDV
ncbi:hypothetical protein [Halorussus limi]|uniref:hypothetical protein n=1 Tax=Halorussus limi TaxID=2938695 RepID=UPI0034A20D4A